MSQTGLRSTLRRASIVALAATASCGSNAGSDRPADPADAAVQNHGMEVWTKAALGEGRADGFGITEDERGNVAVIGVFEKTVDFGGGALSSKGGSDVFVAKLDGAGKHVWSKSFGDGAFQSGAAVELDATGDVVFGGTNQGTIDLGGGPFTAAAGEADVFIAKLDPGGGHLWSHQYGDVSLQSLTDVALDAEGNVHATGANNGTIDFGNGPITSVAKIDVWVAKLDPSGKAIWSRGFGGESSERPAGIAVDSAGNVYVVGVFSGTLDLGGGALVADGEDIFVLKLDPAGKHVWSKAFGGPLDQVATAVAVDGGGNVSFTGTLGGPTDFGGGAVGADASLFVAHLDTNGAHVWSKVFGGGTGRDCRSIAVDAAANVLVTGVFTGTLSVGGDPLVSTSTDASSPDVFVLELDSAGNHVFSKSGRSVGDGGWGIAVDGQGDAAIVGGFSSVVDFGTRLTGGADVRPFVVKLTR